MNNKISFQTRQLIIDELIKLGDFYGQFPVDKFIYIVYPKIKDIESDSRRHKTLENEIRQHMVLNDDWKLYELLYEHLDINNIPDDDFLFFIEKYVDPMICRYRINDDKKEYFDNSECVDIINKYLSTDGYKLSPNGTTGDKIIYKVINTQGGVKGNIKNIIFASKYKPEISISDALNNDINIIKNENAYLVYDLDISEKGLFWNDMVNWYCEKNNIFIKKEEAYLERLMYSLNSDPEKLFLKAYYELTQELKVDKIPALIPQVYLYYDPLTFKQRGYKLFEHQRMDFLMIFSMSERVVIEIDGEHHYSKNSKPSPKLYAKMVSAQREMSLCGYDVFRFGGYEFLNKKECIVLQEVKDFLTRLMQKYDVL